MKTLVDLCGKSTRIVMCYEERTTGNKPEIERKFFKVTIILVNMQGIEGDKAWDPQPSSVLREA